MQNVYVGDIGDFGKYGLLRALADGSLRLGVVWYLFADEKGKGDGRFIGYLCNPKPKYKKLRECDSELHRELHKIVVEENDRRVARIQESRILPNTLYYEQSLSYASGDSRSSREVARRSWLKGALEATREAGIVFVDPDNGISERPIQFRKEGPKRVFMEDLSQFYGRGQSLVIYHHLGRQGIAPEQIKYWATRLQECLGLPHRPWSLWYHRGTARVYFIAPQDNHRDELKMRVKSFMGSPWGKQGHFERVT